MTSLLIKEGRIIDPAQRIDRSADLLCKNGVVVKIADSILPPDGAHIISASGLIVCPGFIDLHCHLREPGFEYKETIASGTAAAARGGFTTICAMPNTLPAIDNRAAVEFVFAKAREEGRVRVLPIACVTKDRGGVELVEMAELAAAGVVGFSDDGSPVSNSNVMRQALDYSSSLGLPIINHCEVLELSHGGSINEGWVSNRLGLKGIPNAAEDAMVARDLSLTELTGGRLHVAHVSTAGSLALIAGARARNINVTCEVTPHHLTLTDESVMSLSAEGDPFAALTSLAYETHAKVNPPLRSRKDIRALVKGLRDGLIDFIATDHAPHNEIEKMTTVEASETGISVIETALGSLMSLVHAGDIKLPFLIEKLTAAPAQHLGWNLGNLRPGAPADVVLIDPDKEWTVDTSQFASKGKNTPLNGATLKGRVVTTIYGGNVVYET